MEGKVMTVLGPIDPSDLGLTLTHEQLLLDLTGLMKKPEYGPDCLSDLEFSIENLGKIRHFPYSVRSNLLLDDPNDVISELKLFKEAGGGTVCDVSPPEVRIKPELLPKLSKESGVHIVAGTAFYVDHLQLEESRTMSIREKADVMVGEIVKGVGGSGMRCGLIGEIGCSWPLVDSERRSLQAAALAQKETGAPLMIHPGANESSPFEIVHILEQSGADLSRTVIGHLDRTIFNGEKLVELARRGCFIELDLFGMENSHYQGRANIDMPNDAQRLRLVQHLIEAGLSHCVLMSQDIHSKHRMVKYGGHGYAHILENIVPKMEQRGISRDTAMKILTENPRNWLTFV